MLRVGEIDDPNSVVIGQKSDEGSKSEGCGSSSDKILYMQLIVSYVM